MGIRNQSSLLCCSIFLVFVLLRKKLKQGQPPHRLPYVTDEKSDSYASKLLRMDWIGTFLFVGGGILILLALSWGSTQEWSTARVIVSFVVGGLLFAACIGWEYILELQKTKTTPAKNRILWADPMLPLDVFRSYDVCAVQFGSFVGGMVTFVMFYFVAIFMTLVSGLRPQDAGSQLIYFAPGLGGGTLITIQMIKFLRQPKYPIILGSLILPVGLGLISMAMEANNQKLVNGFMAFAGVGCGMTTGALIVHARFSQPEHRVAVVSALTLFFRSLGGTVGLAQCSAVLNAKVRSTVVHAVESGLISLSDAVSLSSVSSQALSSLDSISKLPPAVQDVIRDAFREGSRWAFLSIVPWAAVGLVLSLFLTNIKDPQRRKEEEIQIQEKVESAVESNQKTQTVN